MAGKRKTDRADRGGPIQFDMFAPQSDWRPTPVSDLPQWPEKGLISIDVETKDPGIQEKLGNGPRRGGYIVGIGFTIEGGPSHYVPFRHQLGDNLPEDECLRYFRDNAKKFKGEYLGANLGYDLDFLWEDDIESPLVEKYRDIQIADPLIYELHDSFSLHNIGLRYGFQAKNQDMLEQAAKALGLSPKGGLWRLPARYVGVYGEDDTKSPIQIYNEQKKKLDADELWQIFDLESEVLPVLVKMRRRGVRIDVEKLHEIERWTIKEEMQCISTVKEHTGYDIGLDNVWKADALAVPLTKIGMDLKKTSTGAPNIDQVVLGSLDHPVTNAIAWARKVNKLRTTFAASIHKYMIDGRIHCTFNQIARETEEGDQKGARYGRLSSIDPNLQQQPSRDEFASMWRSIYIPDEGGIWGTLDFSQQEPRWTTHFAAILDLPRAQEAAQAYREDPKTDNHTMMTKLIYGADAVEKADKDTFKKWRSRSKIIFLGLCYGEGGAKLCRDLGLPTRWAFRYGRYKERKVEYFETRWEAINAKADRGEGYVHETAGEEGQEIIDHFSAEVPYVPKLADKVKQAAMARGYIKTIMGRRLHFPQREDGSYDWAHKALNRLIQGSSADQTKYALVQMDRAGYYLQLQVHDEVDGTFGSVAEAEDAADIMRNSVLDILTPELPFLVDVECGPSWGEIK